MERTARPRGTDKAEMIEVIKTTSIMGYGTKEDPVRFVYQYWDLKGKLLAFHDTLNDEKVKFFNNVSFIS